MSRISKQKMHKPRANGERAAVSKKLPQQSPDDTNYAVGARIVHPMFGDGTVTAIDADKLTIRFRRGRPRQIVDAYVKHRH